MVARTIQLFYFFTFLCFILLLLLFFYALNKAPLGETGCLTSPYFFTGCSNIKFFDSSLSPSLFQSTASQATLAYSSLWRTCVTYRTSCCSIGDQVLPNKFLPREAEDFPRSVKYPNMCLWDSWDFSMFHQIFLPRQVKWWPIITYNYLIYELPHELPNDLRLNTLRN